MKITAAELVVNFFMAILLAILIGFAVCSHKKSTINKKPNSVTNTFRCDTIQINDSTFVIRTKK